MAKRLDIETAKRLKNGDVLYHATNRNADGTAQRWYVNGKVKTWKRNPSRVYVPLKHDLYSYDSVTERTCGLLFLSDPTVK